MATYVLVHGGAQGGWCWTKVARRLRAAGHDVYTPTLTGLGERAHLLTAETGLDTHIADITAVLYYEDIRDAILVGHSYGGMVITGAADRAEGRVKHLVYLDAVIPRDGESLVDIAPGPMAENRSTLRVVDGVELVLFPGDSPLSSLGVTDPDDLQWMNPRITPHPWKSWTDPLRLSDPEAIDQLEQTVVITPTRIRGDEDRMRRAQQAGRVWHIDTGHALMITEPEATADMLLKVGGLS